VILAFKNLLVCQAAKHDSMFRWYRLIENQVSVTRQDMPGEGAFSGLFDSIPATPSATAAGSPYKVARATIVGEDGAGSLKTCLLLSTLFSYEIK
jgi:hypothetical protein